MSTNASVSGYEGGLGVYDLVEQGYEQYIKIYNDTGAALNVGEVVLLDFFKDADSLSPSARPTVATPATSAIYRQYGVVNNIVPNNLPVAGSVPTNSSTAIADTTWGYIQLRGYCPKIKGTGITAEHLFQGTNASLSASDDGTSYTTDSIGLAFTADGDPAVGYFSGVLFGERTLIG